MRCAICDQALLEDEPVCWQCGSPVAPRPAPDAPVAPAAEPQWPVSRPERKLAQRRVYVTLGILIVGAVLLFAAYRARQPNAERNGATAPPGWAWVGGGSAGFTLLLPERWEVVSARSERQEVNLASMVADTAALSSALQPLSEADTSLRPVLYAHGPLLEVPWENGQALVARSPNLNQLENGAIVALAQQLAREMALELDAARVVGSRAQGYVYLSLNGEVEGAPRRCQQRIYPGPVEALLIVACARPDAGFQETVNQILASFQPLAP